MRTKRFNDYITVSVDTEVDVSWEDVISQLTDDDIKDLYEDVFGKPDTSWHQLYEKRRQLPVEEFLKLIDRAIMDATGRIL